VAYLCAEDNKSSALQENLVFEDEGGGMPSRVTLSVLCQNYR